MRFVLFYHSLLSDWNHGNAHFLRGMVRALSARGHRVQVLEPGNGWSRSNLEAEFGKAALRDIEAAFPGMTSTRYDAATLDLDEALDGADVVLVHEWTDRGLVARIGRHRASGGAYRLLFHDTHHRAVSDTGTIAGFDLDRFDGVLAFGEAVRQVYLRQGWARRAWTWHEAADTALFHPQPNGQGEKGDLVWVGNWGDGERSAELAEYLLSPIRRLELRACVYGVRYPADARRQVGEAGAVFAGWLPNHRVPRTFARFHVTVHVPRRPYVTALPGIPTIRVFEALACGIPLVSAPWDDVEGLFRPGLDFLIARDGAGMQRHLRALLADPALRGTLAASGLERIRERHTCAHRAEELLSICRELGVPAMTGGLA